jgi:AbrB family looped-hinge helix DNA binding protein
VSENQKVRIEFLSFRDYSSVMKATLTSKGQITIPVAIREKLGLKPGDQIDFDENATILVGRRVVDPAEWEQAMDSWRNASREVLQGHPWAKISTSELIDELRGGPVEVNESETGSIQ